MSVTFHSTPPPKVKPLILTLSSWWKIGSSFEIADPELCVDIQPAPTNQAKDQDVGGHSETGTTIDVDHGRTVGMETIMEIEYDVVVIAIDIEDVAEGRVSTETDDECRSSELPIETALHDADDVAIT